MIEFIEREEIKGLSTDEIAKKFQEIVDNYRKEVDDMPIEKCQEEEKQVIELMNKWDEVLKDIHYDLPKEIVNPAGVKVAKNAVGKYICEMLNKVECEFSYTLGYYQLYIWWSKPKSEIQYHTLDSTLHVLGSGLRFRGPHQWEQILTINEYFKPLHDQYSKDNMITYLYSMCHNALLDKMKIEAPVETHEVEAEQGEIHMVEAEG